MTVVGPGYFRLDTDIPLNCCLVDLVDYECMSCFALSQVQPHVDRACPRRFCFSIAQHMFEPNVRRLPSEQQACAIVHDHEAFGGQGKNYDLPFRV
jgi:hypothetical protein